MHCDEGLEKSSPLLYRGIYLGFVSPLFIPTSNTIRVSIMSWNLREGRGQSRGLRNTNHIWQDYH